MPSDETQIQMFADCLMSCKTRDLENNVGKTPEYHVAFADEETATGQEDVPSENTF